MQLKFPSEIEICGAMARGYCWPKNEKKEMDADLVEAMAKEVMGVFDAYLKNEVLIERDKS